MSCSKKIILLNQGYTSIQGPQGPQGREGISAEIGFQGPRGFTGTQGPQGSQGTQGSQGPGGVQGSQGPSGPQGQQGQQGTQGLGGVQGSQGPVGSGTQGLQGQQGTQGPCGVQGSQGPSGTGQQGTQGPQGFSGGTGVQGSQGPQGTVGPQGVSAIGVQGPQGPAGTGTGAASIIAFASGIPVTYNFSIVNPVTSLGGVIAFGNSSSGVSFAGGSIVLISSADMAFVSPRSGTVTYLTTTIRPTSSLAMPFGSSLTFVVQLFQETTDGIFSPTGPAVIIITTSSFGVGTIFRGSTAASFPIFIDTRYALTTRITTSGFTLNMGSFVSAGLAIA